MDRIALITGSTSGLGSKVAEELGLRGWKVLLHGRRQEDVEKLGRRVRELGGSPILVYGDLSERSALDKLVSQVRNAVDHLDLVVNNAALGGGVDPKKREAASDGMEKRMAVNFRAPHIINRGLLPLLQRGEASRIVNVASVGQDEIPLDDINYEISDYDGVTAYSRSKLALIMDTKELATEIGDTTVTVNSVHPANAMPTKMVLESNFKPQSSLDDGVVPLMRLMFDGDLRETTGAYFNRFQLTVPHPQAADSVARQTIMEWVES